MSLELSGQTDDGLLRLNGGKEPVILLLGNKGWPCWSRSRSRTENRRRGGTESRLSRLDGLLPVLIAPELKVNPTVEINVGVGLRPWPSPTNDGRPSGFWGRSGSGSRGRHKSGCSFSRLGNGRRRDNETFALGFESPAGRGAVFNLPKGADVVVVSVFALDFSGRVTGLDFVGAVAALVAVGVAAVGVLGVDVTKDGYGGGGLLVTKVQVEVEGAAESADPGALR